MTHNSTRGNYACRIAIIFLILAGVSFTTACFSQAIPQTGTNTNTELPTGQKNLTLKWGGPKNISMLPLFAEHEGLFLKNNLSATYIEIQTGKKAMDAVRTGDIDLGILVDVNIAFAGFQQADDLRILACIETKHDDAIVVAKGEIEKPADLIGKTIGVTLGTTSHAYLVQFLEANGLKPSDIIMQSMAPPAIQAALLNGSLKAGCVWQPFRNNLMTAHAGSFSEWNNSNIYSSHVLLVCSKVFLEENANVVKQRQAVVAFLTALVSAETVISTNQLELHNPLFTTTLCRKATVGRSKKIGNHF